MEPLRVLIADDTDLIRRMLRERLVDESCEVVGEATNGEEAVQLAKELLPDIIVMDYQMPLKGGVEATREIKKASPGIEIIGYTSTPQPESERRMLEAGASASFDKLNLSQLIETLSSRQAGNGRDRG